MRRFFNTTSHLIIVVGLIIEMLSSLSSSVGFSFNTRTSSLRHVNLRSSSKSSNSFIQAALLSSSSKNNIINPKQNDLRRTFQSSSFLLSKNNFPIAQYNSVRRSGREQVQIGRLYSTTLDKSESVSGSDSGSINNEPYFEAELVSFVTAGDGIGVAAVRVKDNFEIIKAKENNEGSTKVEGGGVPNLFGEISKPAKTNTNKSGGGQGDDLTGRTVLFHTENSSSNEPKSGIIVAQRHPVAFILCNFDSIDQEKTSISILQTKTKIKVSSNLVGKVIDCFGNELISSKPIILDELNEEHTTSKPIFSTIPKVDEIALINTPLLTGITTIDALTPIGKGQNMLIIGSNKEAQQNLVVDMLQKQVEEGTKCIYACTSTDETTRSNILSRLDDRDLSNHIVTVCARTNLDPTSSVTAAAEAVTVASSACTIAEAFARKKNGEDALVIIDVLDYHKDLWDSTTRSLVDIYGADAVVQGDMDGSASSEMRAFYSSLVQRSAKFNANNGGGSLTLVLICSIPSDNNPENGGVEVVEDQVYTLDDFDFTNSKKMQERLETLVKAKIALTASTLRKIKIPIPVATETGNQFRLSMQHVDDLISMSDGQIWLVEDKQQPANTESISTDLILDVQRSVTRIGIGADTKSRADAPALQALTGSIRLELAQALDVMEDSGNTMNSNQAQRKYIIKRDAWLLAMYQKPGQVRSLSEECVALLAVKLGVLDAIVSNEKNTKEKVEVVKKLLDHVWKVAGDDMKAIDEKLDFDSDASKSRLEEVIMEYFFNRTIVCNNVS